MENGARGHPGQAVASNVESTSSKEQGSAINRNHRMVERIVPGSQFKPNYALSCVQVGKVFDVNAFTKWFSKL